MRKQLQRLINELSGDPEHREFVRREEAGEKERSVKEVRAYDLEAADADEIAVSWGVEFEESTYVPEAWSAKYGKRCG